MKTVTFKSKAWITDLSRVNPAQLLNGEALHGLTFSLLDMQLHGWTLVGEAEITVHLNDHDTLVKNAVEALKEEAKNIRAEATAKVTEIEGKIQNLLAITMEK